ncbi:MAG TPA: DUF6089 family protein [Saprospiraceae bacterium]|nr:DUF6089 family protein [Saprospiraceae bacterium]HMQ84223.1 DUF6089 family protein [Saprospiraceae bacterium]
MKNHIIPFAAALLLCLSSIAAAQVVDLGINFGGNFYSGDLSSDDFGQVLQESRPAFGVFCRLSNRQQFSTRFNLNFGGIQGDDIRSKNPQRMLNFRSNLWEFNVIEEWHSWRIRHSEYSHTFPYLYAGVGIFHYNPQGYLDGQWHDLQPLGTEGQGLAGYEQPYKRTQINFPVGAGIRFVVRKFTFGFEAGGRLLLTDYLDDVSATLVNHKEVFDGNGPLAARLSNPNLPANEGVDENYFRGSTRRDWYYMMNITLSYNFGNAIYKMFSNPVPCFKKW